jgi:thiol-disulfide isomerase/thioredoxin
MKKLTFTTVSFFLFYSVFAQAPEVSRDYEGVKVLKGFVTKQELANDTAFKWFGENQKGYTPYSTALQALKTNKDSVSFLVFGGTWCHDTQFILPRFYSLTEAAGFGQDKITLLGVDRSKKTIQHLSEAFNILNVPTIIVLKDGKEIGRVVEYGKTGMFDKELGEIISSHAN